MRAAAAQRLRRSGPPVFSWSSLFRHSSTNVNPFAVLGLPPTATAVEIKAAYLKLAHLHHPDKSDEPDAAARFRAAKDAFDAATEAAESSSLPSSSSPFTEHPNPFSDSQQQHSWTSGSTYADSDDRGVEWWAAFLKDQEVILERVVKARMRAQQHDRDILDGLQRAKSERTAARLESYEREYGGITERVTKTFRNDEFTGYVEVSTTSCRLTTAEGEEEEEVFESWIGEGGVPRKRTLKSTLSGNTRLARQLFCPDEGGGARRFIRAALDASSSSALTWPLLRSHWKQKLRRVFSK